jgi:hypothetical protein
MTLDIAAMRAKYHVHEQTRAGVDDPISRILLECADDVNALLDALEAAAANERAAVVAFLRRETYPCCNQCNNQLADYIERNDRVLVSEARGIERGEHRREEK